MPDAPGDEMPSAKAKEMIGALTGCAAMVQSCGPDNDQIKQAIREWGTAKSELSAYVASLESRLTAISQATVTHDPEAFRNRVISILTRATPATDAPAETRDDTARLDWLEAQGCLTISLNKVGQRPEFWDIDQGDHTLGTGATLREAIDAAVPRGETSGEWGSGSG